MLQIAICDDEPIARKMIKKILNTHSLAHEFSISEFESCETLCGQLLNGVLYDLIILDIEFPGKNGVDAGHFLRDKLNDNVTQILYVSAKDGYEKSLFDNRPINFLQKPVNEQKMHDCLNRVLKMAHEDSRLFTFSINRTISRIPLKNIRYFENDKRRLILHSYNQDYIFYQKLDEIEDLPGFIRIHKSYLINSLYVRKVFYDKVELDKDTTLSISFPYRKQTREFLLRNSGIL